MAVGVLTKKATQPNDMRNLESGQLSRVISQVLTSALQPDNFIKSHYLQEFDTRPTQTNRLHLN
jgi:hypothetical protein